MTIARALAILGAGASGYGAGQDQARRQQREEEDAAWQKKQRQRTETQWQRDDEEYAKRKADEQATTDAAKPVEVTTEQLQGPTEDGSAMPTVNKVAGKAYDTPEAAAAAAAAANTPAERMRRAAGAMRDPVRAAQTEAAAGQADLGQMQLAAARWERDVGQAMVGGQWAGLTKLMTDSGADGVGGKAKFTHEVSPDGKSVVVSQVDDKGQPVGQVGTFPNNDEGLATLGFLLKSRTKPEAMVEHFRRVSKDKADAADKDTDNKRLDAAQKEVERHNAAMERIGMAGVAARGAGGAGGAAGQPEQAPVWDAKADERIFEHFKKKDELTGATSYDGEGAKFAKQVGVAASRRFGGDTLQAVGYAIDVDNNLQARAQANAQASGGKVTVQQALSGLRSQALAAMNAPPPAPAAPPGGPPPSSAIRNAPPGSVALKPGGGYGAPAGPAYGSAEDERMRLAAALKGQPVLQPGMLPAPIFRPPQAR